MIIVVCCDQLLTNNIIMQDGRCSMADACSNPPSAEGVYYMIMKNFQRHYNTNRAPFLLSYHPAW